MFSWKAEKFLFFWGLSDISIQAKKPYERDSHHRTDSKLLMCKPWSQREPVLLAPTLKTSGNLSDLLILCFPWEPWEEQDNVTHSCASCHSQYKELIGKFSYPSVMWWFEWEMPAMTLHILTLDPELMALFREVQEVYVASAEEVWHGGQTGHLQSCPLPVDSALFSHLNIWALSSLSLKPHLTLAFMLFYQSGLFSLQTHKRNKRTSFSLSYFW